VSYNKTVNDWPHGKQYVLFPLASSQGTINESLGETKVTVSLGASHFTTCFTIEMTGSDWFPKLNAIKCPQKFSAVQYAICSSKKYLYSPHRRDWNFWGG